MLSVKTKENTLQYKHFLVASLRNMGFTYVSLGFKRLDQEDVLGIFSHDDWQREYVTNSYFLHDPLLNAALKITDCFLIWDHISPKDDHAFEIMNLRNNMCDTCSGITFSYVENNVHIVLAVGGEESYADFSMRYTGNFEKIRKVSNEIMNDALSA